MVHKVQSVMVVDDEQLDLRMMQRSFAAFEDCMTLEQVQGSDGALGAIQQSRPDLLLLDIAMPGTSGFELLSQLRGQDDADRPVVIMLSSSEDPNDIERAYKLGAAGYIVKPTTLDGYRELASSVSCFWGRQVVRPN